jgi:DNA-directed RNA polymerase subunit RPC12/RpoP
MRFNSIFDPEQLHDSLTGAPLAGVALSDLFRCSRCNAAYRAASVLSLQDENGAACIACSGVGTVKPFADSHQTNVSARTAAYVLASRSGLKIIAEIARTGEADLLTGNEWATFFLKHLSGEILIEIAPTEAWTHTALLALVDSAEIAQLVEESGGADTYIGSVWIGGTEV